MSSQRQLPHPLQNLADVLAPAHAELRLGPQYYGNFGFRRLLLAETVLAQTEQQGPCGWHLRSAVIGFDTEPCHGIANIEAMHRPVFNTSLLTHINLVQHGRTIVSAAGAFDRDWQSTGAAPQPCVDFGAPLDLPPLENWPEDADKDCRDASQQLAAADEFQTLGGFARHRELRTGGPHDFVSLLEPWVTMPDPRGRWREIDELTIEMHARTPLSPKTMTDYFKVLVARNEWTAGTERLVAEIWSHAGHPIATIYLSATLTG